MTGKAPENVFKDYVKAVIREIIEETPGASLNPDVERFESRIAALESYDIGVELDNLGLDFDRLDGMQDLGTRVEAIESAMSDIGSAAGQIY